MRKPLLLLLCSLVAPPVHAQGLPPPVDAALRAARIEPAGVALYLRAVDETQAHIAVNESQPMLIASAMKLVTTYAALELLGVDYTWKTEVYVQGELRGESLYGDLLLKGTGDPRLDLPRFHSLLREIAARGVRHIRGDLVLDRSAFEAVAVEPGSFDGEPLRPYNVAADALLVNANTVRLGFFPGRDAPRIDLTPPLATISIDNRLTLADGPCGNWKRDVQAEVLPRPGGTQLVFAGHYPLACGERFWHLNLLPPNAHVLETFRAMWRELGGARDGDLREGTAAAGARLLLEFRSPPLAEVLREMNKYSNNVMAKNVFLSIAAAQLGAPARAGDAVQLVQRWLFDKGLRGGEIVLENGSGLSRVERASARALGELLLQVYASASMPEYVASLPLAGRDGTLWKRFLDSPAAGRAHLKTGLLDGVRSLAGYLLDAQGRRWVLVFIVNDPRADAAVAAQEALLRWIYGER